MINVAKSLKEADEISSNVKFNKDGQVVMVDILTVYNVTDSKLAAPIESILNIRNQTCRRVSASQGISSRPERLGEANREHALTHGTTSPA